MTGLWDGYIVFTGNDLINKKLEAVCGKDPFIRVSNLLEVIDGLYKQEENRKLSPASLLKIKDLKVFAAN